MRLACSVWVCYILWLLAASASADESGVFPGQRIRVGAFERSYRLVVPDAAAQGKRVPLVFAFHGLGDSADNMAAYSRLDAVALKHGFVLVYPQGRNLLWPLLPEWAGEDFALFDALYMQLAQRYRIDAQRVYLIGMSNGAYFANLLASQRADKIAALAMHSGGLGAIDRAPRAKYAVMIVHGSADVIIPVEEARRARAAYARWGHAVEYVEVPGMNHLWAGHLGIGERMWKFFAVHQRR